MGDGCIWIRVQQHGHHKVGAVSGGGQNAASLSRLVEWAQIIVPLGQIGALQWPQPNQWHRVEEHAWPRFGEIFVLAIPASALQKDAIHKHTIVGRRYTFDSCLINRQNLIIKGQQIYGNDIFTRIILLGAGKESLGKKETRQPEGRRCAMVVPVLQREYVSRK